MSAKELGQRIRIGRMSRGMTQANLAEALGVAQSTIGMWEQGRREPDLDAIEALADVFNTTLSYFIEEEDIVHRPDVMSKQDHDALNALHKNPKLRLLFDRQKDMDDTDIDFMLSLAARIMKERDGE